MMFVRALALLLALGSSALAQSGQIPSATVWGNAGASKAIASPATFSAMFDRAFGSTGGSLIARSGAAWGLVSGTATARLPLLSGASTTPVWGAYTLPASVTSGGVSCFTSTSAAGSSVLLTASALVLGGGAGVCPSPMASLGTTTTVLHGNAAGAPTFAAVATADLAQSAASTLKGNPTASTGNIQDFTVTGLTLKPTPAGGDELLLSDSAASNVFKKATVTSLLSAGAVTSIAGNTGAFTLSTGITNSGNDIRRASAAGFAAHKNSTDQTALLHASYNTVTWPTTSDNVGGYFDTTNNWWTPPTGYVSLKAAVWQSQNAASTSSPTFVLKILRTNANGVTISNASPGVITWPLHGLAANRPVQFTTTGALPTGLVALTVYYVKTALDANTFTVSATVGGAAINTSSAGSGVHSGFCDVAAGVGTANTGTPGQAIAQVGHDYAYSNGTDHFITNFFTTSSTAANNGVVDGNPAHTHFSGVWVSP